eukprot:3440525-Pyramimonas_sp.AAC.1
MDAAAGAAMDAAAGAAADAASSDAGHSYEYDPSRSYPSYVNGPSSGTTSTVTGSRGLPTLSGAL